MSQSDSPQPRPPAFDMTYRASEHRFGPPLALRLPSLLYLAIALVVCVIVVAGELSPPGSALHVYVIERDAQRPISSRALAIVLTLSALSSVLRSSMRGVRIRADGLEYRDVVSVVVPRVRRYNWAQIDRIVLDQPTIALDLWDGTRAALPDVSDRAGLVSALEKVAHARSIAVRGGPGLDDLPDSKDF